MLQATSRVLVYLAATIAPLALAWSGVEPGRGFLINFSVALGFVGLSLMGLQFVIAARFPSVAAPFGIDVLLQYHRQIAYTSLLFILAHPILLFIADTDYLALLDLTTSPLRAKMAVTSTLALIVMVALSVWREKLRLSYELWQLTHSVLAFVVIAAALTHVLLVGYYVNEPLEIALWIWMAVVFVGLVLWVRVVRPLELRTKAWRIEDVMRERGNICTIVLKPTRLHARKFDGFHFEPGQFAWITVNKSPFAITRHPFSISSSAEKTGRVAVSIKASGDFTRNVSYLKPGTTVYLDGPHGAFTMDRHDGPGFVFIGAGVGITPLMSMLRTMADRGDPRPCHLFFGNREWEGIAFREEIEELKGRLNLEVMHVLSRPPEGWEGEKGRIDAAVLARHLPERYQRLQYFICGSDSMMNATEDALVQLRVPKRRIHTERFGMV
ncbi:MAG: ferric reductase-like transmembrane domain-containing protein [Actinomycetota bacterium]|nr:ferric reductase-like transmembrane domain-containing protein [Actinomycetota bacterium]